MLESRLKETQRGAYEAEGDLMRRATTAQYNTHTAELQLQDYEQGQSGLRKALREEEQMVTQYKQQMYTTEVTHNAQVVDLKRQNDREKEKVQYSNLQRGTYQTGHDALERDLMKAHKDFHDQVERSKSQQLEITAKNKEVELLKNQIKHNEDLRKQAEHSQELQAQKQKEKHDEQMKSLEEQMEQLQDMYAPNS